VGGLWALRFRDRSGVVADWVEIFGSESRSQRYMFVADVVAQTPSVNLVVHDDACHMARYCRHANRFTDGIVEKGSCWRVSWRGCACLSLLFCRLGPPFLHAHARKDVGPALVFGPFPQRQSHRPVVPRQRASNSAMVEAFAGGGEHLHLRECVCVGAPLRGRPSHDVAVEVRFLCYGDVGASQPAGGSR
jgi:hypothetical protein